jgi:hypothetical protein
MARAPVVRLRDGTSVSVFPSRLYLRGRDHGWIRETLEGAIHLIGCEVIDPRGREAEWVLRDYEDNRYISDRYGYQIEDYERYWFGRGGFSMQPNLLWGPVAYALRDEVPQFIRAYFNSFASAYRPDVQMLTEHPLPALGDCIGDHFKTSDEAQSTNWLRLMYLREEGRDLYVAQGIPRAWFAPGRTVGIERAATWFGPMGWAMDAEAGGARISLIVRPPKRNPPERMFVRIRHPEGRAATRFVVNGVPAPGYDPKREWVVLEAPYPEELRLTADY